MFKSLKNSAFVILAGLIVASQFQNCAPTYMLGGDEDSDSQLAIVEIDMNHPGQDHGSEIPIQEKPALEQSKTLLDRIAIYNMFLDIFGPTAANLASMKTLKADKAVMGSPCSVYDQFRSKRANFQIDPAAEPCANSDAASSLSAPLNPVGNVLHQALINNVCQEAVMANTVNYTLAQIRGSIGNRAPDNTEENVLRLFRLFYRGKPEPHEALVQSLQILIGEPATLVGWKTAISTTCVSSHWQAL